MRCWDRSFDQTPWPLKAIEKFENSSKKIVIHPRRMLIEDKMSKSKRNSWKLKVQIKTLVKMSKTQVSGNVLIRNARRGREWCNGRAVNLSTPFSFAGSAAFSHSHGCAGDGDMHRSSRDVDVWVWESEFELWRKKWDVDVWVGLCMNLTMEGDSSSGVMVVGSDAPSDYYVASRTGNPPLAGRSAVTTTVLRRLRVVLGDRERGEG